MFGIAWKYYFDNFVCESLCLPLEIFAIEVTVVMDPACDMRVTVNVTRLSRDCHGMVLNVKKFMGKSFYAGAFYSLLQKWLLGEV